MFVQVIEGKAKDPDLWRRQGERWLQELQPGAKGYLGHTGGITADGVAIDVARFESEADARANSDRPEQGAWWNETEKAYDSPVTFTESSDTELLFGGGSNDAGFVQIMKGTVGDPASFRQWGKDHEGDLKKLRPDLLGGLDIWQPDGSYISVAYFTSEAEARKNEGAMGDSPMMGEYMSQHTGEIQFLDITDPVID
ncbi:MAG: hypothetical protein JOZ68_19710 [Acidimicrobiia bacterium]|nr:hypothetical protein [Acidimicrobiia bacterium]